MTRDAAPFPFESPARQATPGHGRRSTRRFMLMFSGFWTLVVMIFNVVIAVSAVRSMHAATFPTVQGMVLSSEVASHMGGEDRRTRMYSARIRYRYFVDDIEYTSDRHRYGSMSSSSSGSARAAVENHREGAAVTVHYNPSDPADAVLETGMDGETRFFIIFLTPFNAMMLGTWVFAARSLSGRPRPRITQGPVVRVHLERIPSLAAACGAALAVGFPLVFLFAFAFDGSASAAQLTTHLTLVGMSAFAAAAYFEFRRRSGHYDLLVDPIRRVVTVPVGLFKGEVADRDVPFTKVRDVRIEDSTTTRVGNEPLRNVMLECGGPSIVGPVRLRGFVDRADAERFAAWLRQQVGVSNLAVSPASTDFAKA